MEHVDTLVAIAGGVFGIAGTVAAIYFAYQNRRLAGETALPTMDLRISNPPPYECESDCTEIVIKNVGGRKSGRVGVRVVCSWSEEVEYNLTFPSNNWCLGPNEEYRWKLRFAYGGDIKGDKMVIRAEDDRTTWEITEKIT